MPKVGIAAVALALAAGTGLWLQRGQGGTVRAPIGTSTIVLLGDSLTEEGDWEALLPAWPTSNQGYAGSTSQELVPVAESVAAERPRLVLILSGTNDIRDGRSPAWTERYLAEILDRFAVQAPETTVVVQTLLPRADAVAEVAATNERIVALAGQRGLAVIDLHPHFDDGSGGLRPAETRDGLHLTAVGYRRLADLVAAFLDREIGPG